jgi:hypothetical protein
MVTAGSSRARIAPQSWYELSEEAGFVSRVDESLDADYPGGGHELG